MKQQMIRAFVPKTWDVRFYFIALDNRFQRVSLVVILLRLAGAASIAIRLVASFSLLIYLGFLV